MDISVDTMRTPAGIITIGSTDKGLLYVRFAKPAQVMGDSQEEVKTQLQEYFEGRRKSFDFPIDESLIGSDFHKQVIKEMSRIPYGETRSYQQIATSLGTPGAVRAVGSACARNPLPIIFPCHRVVRADGNIGEYAGGRAIKRYLLALEEKRTFLP